MKIDQLLGCVGLSACWRRQGQTNTKTNHNLKSTGPLSAALLAGSIVFSMLSGAALAIDLEVRGKGVAIRNAGTSGQRHMYPLGTRSDWENGRFMTPGRYHIFDGARPSRISGLNYATTPITGNYHDRDNRSDYDLDAFRSNERGEVFVSLPRSGDLGGGWERVPGAFPTSIQTYYLHRYNYTTPGQWVDVPKADDTHPSLLFTDGDITWSNPLPISTLAEGVMIAPRGGGYVIDPNMIIMPNGDYIASARGAHTSKVNGRTVYERLWKSTDKGRSWSRLHDENTDLQHATLLERNGELFLIGDIRNAGAIQRSRDGGKTWSDPVRFGFYFRTSPSHVITAKGRYWIATEVEGNKDATVISAPVSADLMNPRSWTLARRTGDRVGNNSQHVEADLVAQRNGEYPIVMAKAGSYARVVSPTLVTSDRNRDRISLPGNNAKYGVIYDAVTDRYWALTSHSGFSGNIRTGITLFSSSDLTTWRSEKEVLRGLSQKFHGFNYPFMQIDGGDMVFTLRTAWEDSSGVAQRWHDANMYTFHRIRDFRGNVTTPPPPPPPSGDTNRLVVRNGGNCIDIEANSQDNSANAQQWGCHSRDNQQFEVVDVGGGYVELKAKHSGKCLNVAGNSDADGANIIQWTCRDRNNNGFANSQFRMESQGGGWFSLVARNSGKCLDINAASTEAGANLEQYNCHGGNNQQFRLD